MRVAIGLVQVLFMVGGPLAVTALLRSRWRLPWSMWAIGAVGFVGSQIVHQPLLIWLGPSFPKNVVLLSAIVGFLAGVCEEPARYLVFRYWLKDARGYREGVFIGVGHGGIESILFGLGVGVTILGSMSVTADDPAIDRAMASAVLGAPTLLRVLAMFERVCTMTFHTAMSLVVMTAVRRNRLSLLGLAIFLHALSDAFVVWANARHGMIGAEIVCGFSAAFALFVILHARRVDRIEREARAGVVDHAVEPAKDQAISTRALTKEFANRTAVDAMTVDVAPGKVFAMLGPNGAGKTTTVRMLCALIPPTRGTARVAGSLIVTEEDALRSRVGILTETPGLYERLTAWENLELFGRLYGLDEKTRAERIERHLRAFDIWERRDDAVSGFSKGMKQKLAIVRALIHEPDVLFLDEPTSGLDPVASREVHDMILALKKQGRTILLTTHRLTEAEELADLVAIVRGRVLALDTVENLKARMFGTEVLVRVGNPSEKLAASLTGYENVRWDGAQLSVAVSDIVRDTPALVRALVERGADIVSVGEAKHSLEEIYLGLVQEKSE